MFYGNLGNFLGFLAAICYLLTLLPSLIRIVVPKFFPLKLPRLLLKYRREIGVMAWIFGFLHGTFIVVEKNLNLLDLNVAKNFLQGLALITIFTLLAVTSNDYSLKYLKQNWKKLHRITYLGLLILPWHILDKMSPKWSITTPITLTLILVFIFLSLIRIWIYYNHSKLRRNLK
ncbi:MAG: ferric reductase-like transmembrane domain-containing protein [bacterium]